MLPSLLRWCVTCTTSDPRVKVLEFHAVSVVNQPSASIPAVTAVMTPRPSSPGKINQAPQVPSVDPWAPPNSPP